MKVATKTDSYAAGLQVHFTEVPFSKQNQKLMTCVNNPLYPLSGCLQ